MRYVPLVIYFVYGEVVKTRVMEKEVALGMSREGQEWKASLNVCR